MKTITIFFLAILFAIPIMFVGNFVHDVIFDNQTSEEKNILCEESCLGDGWEHGEWIGYQFCNCFNSTIRDNNSQNLNNKSKEKEYEIETFIVKPYSLVHVWRDGLLNCKEYVDESHSFEHPDSGIIMDEVSNNNDFPITCKYKVEVERIPK